MPVVAALIVGLLQVAHCAILFAMLGHCHTPSTGTAVCVSGTSTSTLPEAVTRAMFGFNIVYILAGFVVVSVLIAVGVSAHFLHKRDKHQQQQQQQHKQQVCCMPKACRVSLRKLCSDCWL